MVRTVGVAVLVLVGCGRFDFQTLGDGNGSGASDDDTGGSVDQSGWHVLPTQSGAPSLRAHHSAVWTGSEMIVWGGNIMTFLPLGDGGRYDPTTQTWTPVIADGTSPAARGRHSAVWTGTEMIVWGGDETSTGGRFNPASGTWSAAVSSSGSPTPRYWAATAWTGTEMLVWSGVDSAAGQALADGGRYRPATDSWGTSITVTGAPLARMAPAGVWTGTEMLVWGGFDLNGSMAPLDTGGRYNPATDTWGAALTTIGAPSPRYEASAIWTGSEMIVWGGTNGVSQFADGGRYDPSTNTWQPLVVTGGPAARWGHSAVWTGSEMIVWGGDLSNGNFNFATDSYVWVP